MVVLLGTGHSCKSHGAVAVGERSIGDFPDGLQRVAADARWAADGAACDELVRGGDCTRLAEDKVPRSEDVIHSGYGRR